MFVALFDDKYMDKKIKRKYVYDFPEQRKIAYYLFLDDKSMIAHKTGLSIRTVKDWCKGKRRNPKVMELAVRFAKINQDIELIKSEIKL
jgi:hypothetical protein